VNDIERMREYVINRWGRVTPNRMGVAAAALGLPIEVCPYEDERRSKPGFKAGYNWEKHLNMRRACPHGLFAQSCEQCQIATLRAELAEARRERDGLRRQREEVEAERNLLREFMRDACAALKCEQNDEPALLAIEELRDALEKIAASNYVSTGAIMLAEIARAAVEGKP
jgi:hypothetical protein